MCILFGYVNNSPSVDGYQIIVAMNRDEFFSRPTKQAEIWSNGHCISGRDLEAGREGGTWFGVSTHGKIASLLNITEAAMDPDKKGRGNLVSDYISSDIDLATYSDHISVEAEEYNGFNLLLLGKLDSRWSIQYCSNRISEKSQQLQIPDDRIIAISNTTYSQPLTKTTCGRAKFAEIVREAAVSKHDELRESLLSLLSDKTCNLPDARSAIRSSLHPNLSAIFVDMSDVAAYGTRTQTILLIDAHGVGEYFEKTMTDPIDPSCPTWKTTVIPFSLSKTNETKHSFL